MTFLPDKITERDEFPDDLIRILAERPSCARKHRCAWHQCGELRKSDEQGFCRCDDRRQKVRRRAASARAAAFRHDCCAGVPAACAKSCRRARRSFWRRFRRGSGHARPARARTRRDQPDGQVERAYSICGRRRDRNACVLSAGTRRTRGCGRGRARSDFAACARTRWTTRSRDERRGCGATSPCTSPRRTRTASAARRPTSPDRSRARWRGDSAAFENNCTGEPWAARKGGPFVLGVFAASFGRSE